MLVDWDLVTVTFDWETKRVALVLSYWQHDHVELIANDCVDIHIPGRNEWGPSVSVNSFDGPSEVENGNKRLTIEMQSGDVITIIARSFDMPADPNILDIPSAGGKIQS